MNKKAQVAMEYVLIVGFVLVIMIPAIAVYSKYSATSQDDIIFAKLNNIAQEIVDKVNEVYYYGEGSQNTMTIELPERVHAIEFDGKEMIITIDDMKGGLTEIVKVSDVFMEGTIYNTPGTKDVVIKAFANKVVVKSIEEKIGLLVKDLTNIISDTMVGNFWNIGVETVTGSHIYGWVDTNDVFTDEGATSSAEQIRVTIFPPYAIQNKEYVTIAHDNQQRRIYFKEKSSNVEDLILYAGSDGATYYDANLTSLFQGVIPANEMPLKLTDLDVNDGINYSVAGPHTLEVDMFLIGDKGTQLGELADEGDGTLGYYDGLVAPLNWTHIEIVYANNFNFPSGAYFTIKDSEGDVINVYLPAGEIKTGDKFYIAEEGSTYYDKELTSLAQAAP